MKNSFIIYIFFLFFSLQGYAQSITGKIYDSETKEPVIGATIKLLDSEVGTITNHEGYFELASKGNNAKIKISMVGYKDQEFEVTAGKPVSISFVPAIEELQSVVVTANREAGLRTEAAMAISKLPYKMLDEAKVISISELLNKASGVMMVSLNNEQHMMSIRQPITTNGYYLYMEDGVPIRPMGVFNHNALLETNQFALSSVEIVKGPVSSIYGPEAVGGAVNFIMQRPTSVPTFKIGTQFDQWGYRRLQFGGGATMGKFGIYVGGLLSQQINSWMASSDYDKNIVNAKLEYHFTARTRLTGTYMYANYFSQTSGSVDSTAFYSQNYISATNFTYRKSLANRARLTLEHDWLNGSKSFITLFYRYNEHGQDPSYSIKWVPKSTTATGQVNSSNFSSYGLIAQHTQILSFLDTKIIAGAMFDYSPNDYWAYRTDLTATLRPGGNAVQQYNFVQDRPDIQISNYNAFIKNTAAYLQYEFRPIQRLKLSVGGRYDLMSFSFTNNIDFSRGSKSYSQFTFKAGMTFDLGKDKGLYTNFAQGFGPPALTAIFTPVPNSKPVDFFYDLQAAQFMNYEVGGWASFMKHKLYIDFAFYQMNGQNELLNIRQPDNSFLYQSAGKTLHRGIELGVTFRPTKEFFFRFSGTTALHKFEDFQISNNASDAIQNLGGYEMPGAPRWIWNTELTYYPKWLPGFRSALEWQHVSAYYQDQINRNTYNGYFSMNLRVGYQWKGIEVYSNVMNLGDALYAYNSARGNLATSNATYTPAAPRTFVMGIQYTFTGKK